MMTFATVGHGSETEVEKTNILI